MAVLPPRRKPQRRATATRARSHRPPSPAQIGLAKLTPPSLPKLVERNHLVDQIDKIRQLGTKVLWIQASPGAGKTTLAASYLKTNKQPSLWFQLNAGDTDPATWFRYLTIGIQQAAPRFRTPMLAFEPAYLANLPSFTRRFFEQLFGRLKSPSLVVFDNYHDLPTNSPVQALMVEVFRMVPPGVLCMVTSRQAPPPIMARLIADQTLTELSADALALNLAETEQLLALHQADSGETVSPEGAQQLHTQTQGWVAGVILLGSKALPSHRAQLTTSQPVSKQTRNLTDHPILFDYFVQESLTCLSPEVRMLLLKTAMFPAFGITMAERLTGLPQVGYELNKLARARYFVESREGGEQTIFQYHPLFKQFLCQQAELEFGRDTWQTLQTQAAEVLVEEGWIEEAIQLKLETKAIPQVTRLLIKQAPAMMEQGRFHTLGNLLARLPNKAFEAEPYLLYWQGMSQLFHAPAESLPYFQTVFPIFEARGDVPGMLLAASGAIYSIDFSWTDLDRIDKWHARIDALWDTHISSLSAHVQSTVISAVMRGLFWRQPHRTIVHTWIKRAETFVQHYDRLSELTIMLHHILCCSRSFGGIQDALQAIAPASKRLDQCTLSPANQLAWEISQIGIAWVTGDFYAADTHFQRGAEVLRQHEVPPFRGPLQFNGLYAALQSQNLEVAETILSNETFSMQQMGLVFYAIGMFQKGWFHALKGNLGEALDCAQHSIVLAQQSKGQHFEGVATLGLALVLAASKRFEEVEQPLSEVETVATTLDHVSLTYSCALLRTYVLLETGPRPEAISRLDHAMKLGSQHAIFYTYESWLPSVLAPLCALALEENIEPDYVRQLIRNKQLTLDSRVADTLDWPWPIRMYTLGQFLITIDEDPVVFGRKAPLMPLRLLKLLISLGGQNMALTRLSDELWPDAEGDAAYRSILTTLTRLRKLLGREDALVVQGGILSLNTHICWVDSLAFEHRGNRALREGQAGNTERANTSCLQALRVYEGPFLPADDECLEVGRKRDQLQTVSQKLQDLAKGG